ncbi:MAG: helix-turn-helix domain-containing protein [Salinarimonas sp.]
MPTNASQVDCGRSPSEVSDGMLPELLFGERPCESFAPGSTLFWEGDPADWIFRLVSGTVRLDRHLRDGRRIVAAFPSRGDVIGLTLAPAQPFCAHALTRVVVQRAARDRLEALLCAREIRPHVLARVAEQCCARQDELLALLHERADARVARFLLDRVRRERGVGRAGVEASAEIALPMSRADIADHLGLTTETVCRAFTQLRSEGIIDLRSPGRVVIARPSRLQARERSRKGAAPKPATCERPRDEAVRALSAR